MCYFTKKVLNKRFLPNRKNGWNPPVCKDERFRYVEVECGHCFECRKKKRREWRIRNYEQLKETPHAVFFTGTVSPQRYEYICKKYGFKDDGSQDNEIITKIHRLFLERIRKQIEAQIEQWSQENKLAGKRLDLEEKKAIAETILKGIEIVQGIGRAVGTNQLTDTVHWETRTPFSYILSTLPSAVTFSSQYFRYCTAIFRECFTLKLCTFYVDKAFKRPTAFSTWC